MQTIITLDQHALGFAHEKDREIGFDRRAARCVLRSQLGEIAVIFFARDNFYKLPGGGVEEDEALDSALHREVREETGFTITNVRELGMVEEYRYYCGMHQLSYCYVADAVDDEGTSLTPEETAAGVELRWAPTIDDAIALIRDANGIDEEGSVIGLAMMKLRDEAILEASRPFVGDSTTA